MARGRDDICAEIAALAHEPDYIYSLVRMLAHDLFYDPAEAADINWRQRLSYQEFTFLAGFLVQRPIELAHPDERELLRRVAATYALFEELHASHGARIAARMAEALDHARSENGDPAVSARSFFGAGDVMTEPIFYSGSGAYDFQYWEFAPRRYSLDEEWIGAQKGFQVAAAAQIVKALKGARTPFAGTPTTPSEVNDALLEMFCVSRADVPEYSGDEVDAFFDAFSVEAGKVNSGLREPGAYNVLMSRPMIKLREDTYFVPVHFNLAQSLYESPFYWMVADDSYKDVAAVHRGEATELLTRDLLGAVFGAANVFRGVSLFRGGRVVAEIDVLAVLYGKALIVQCKSKKLTEIARRGNTEQLKSDFRDAVQRAYEQGLACRALLLDENVEARTADGALVDVDVEDAFIACVVSDHYPSLAHQAHTYLTRRSDSDPYPVALSVFDLDVICFYLNDPFELLYYVRQRTTLAEYFRSDEEISLLAYHLKKKLFRVPGVDMIAVTPDMAQLVDANFPVARGEVPDNPSTSRLFHEWKNDYFDELVGDLKGSQEAGFVDAVLLLYDFAGDSIDRLIKLMLEAKAKARSDGKSHTLGVVSDEANALIVFVTRADRPELLDVDVLAYAQAKKYDVRAEQVLGLGSMASSEKLAEVVVYNSDPWVEDAQLSELASAILTGGTVIDLTE